LSCHHPSSEIPGGVTLSRSVPRICKRPFAESSPSTVRLAVYHLPYPRRHRPLRAFRLLQVGIADMFLMPALHLHANYSSRFHAA
jgi:hypothetical protein